MRRNASSPHGPIVLEFKPHLPEIGAPPTRSTGRPSVPPSILATALVLQTYDRVSDEEATERASFDLRWKTALGIPLDEVPYAKSTLQLFRAHLLVHEFGRLAFERSLKAARNRGHLKGRMRLAVDTTNIFGRGAVKDTYNLLGDGIVLVMRALAAQEEKALEEWAAGSKLERYITGSSLKGEADLDWDDAEARKRGSGCWRRSSQMPMACWKRCGRHTES